MNKRKCSSSGGNFKKKSSDPREPLDSLVQNAVINPDDQAQRIGEVQCFSLVSAIDTATAQTEESGSKINGQNKSNKQHRRGIRKAERH